MSGITLFSLGLQLIGNCYRSTAIEYYCFLCNAVETAKAYSQCTGNFYGFVSLICFLYNARETAIALFYSQCTKHHSISNYRENYTFRKHNPFNRTKTRCVRLFKLEDLAIYMYIIYSLVVDGLIRWSDKRSARQINGQI